MRTAAGILLVILGVAYPMAAVFWLNGRMARQPALTARQVSLVLAFNGVLPAIVILGGIAALVPRLWDRPEFRMGTGLAALVGLVLLILLLAARRQAARPGGTSAGPAKSDARSGDGG